MGFAQASEHLAVVNQHNTLWDALSCADHLRLFARLRMLENEVEDAVAATLARVELLNHADKPAGRLSGGMKRKLCGACALIGDPQIVLLDEPSAGLDPVSQRNLWNLIKATMAGRAVVLTTHSMVEADFLCDRIGIMVQGQLRCLGTSDHLKQRYASGYELVVKIEDDALEGVSAFVKERFGATLAAADAGTLTYELSKSSEKSADLLADAFQAFDESTRKSLKVAEFSVVQASLEKVFIRIVSGEGGEHEARDAHNRSLQVPQYVLLRHVLLHVHVHFWGLVVRLVQYLYPYLTVPHVRRRHELCGEVLSPGAEGGGLGRFVHISCRRRLK